MQALLRDRAEEQPGEPTSAAGADRQQVGTFRCVEQRRSGQVAYDTCFDARRAVGTQGSRDIFRERLLSFALVVPASGCWSSKSHAITAVTPASSSSLSATAQRRASAAPSDSSTPTKIFRTPMPFSIRFTRACPL
jgi:hypothetical protein